MALLGCYCKCYYLSFVLQALYCAACFWTHYIENCQLLRCFTSSQTCTQKCCIKLVPQADFVFEIMSISIITDPQNDFSIFILVLQTVKWALKYPYPYLFSINCTKLGISHKFLCTVWMYSKFMGLFYIYSVWWAILWDIAKWWYWKKKKKVILT